MTEDGTSREDTIWVYTTDDVVVRGKSRGQTPLKVGVLADNVNQFLGQIESILAKAPEVVGDFEFTEFEITAEVTAEGSLSLLGTGIQGGATGGLSFRFHKKSQ